MTRFNGSPCAAMKRRISTPAASSTTSCLSAPAEYSRSPCTLNAQERQAAVWVRRVARRAVSPSSAAELENICNLPSMSAADSKGLLGCALIPKTCSPHSTLALMLVKGRAGSIERAIYRRLIGVQITAIASYLMQPKSSGNLLDL
jgi:hypothetical protein